MVDLMFSTRRNKRYGRDAMTYEMSWTGNVVRDFLRREDRTFRIDHNYTFLVSVPKWREIFATEFAGRLGDHELYERISSHIEAVLSPRTYNNRKGKGSQAAINQLIEDICEVSNGYTKPAWVIKVDLKGYFPSALWDVAYGQLCSVIDSATNSEEERSYLKWLCMTLVHANPAAHCERRTPTYLWKEHISPDKSLFSKPEGEGAAIGRLIWQTAMGLYINDEIKWLNEECGLRVVCFVDDIVFSVPERQKAYVLSLLPELRRRLAKKNIRLNEKKFYCQPYQHGLEFLGSHIKPYRIHLNNSTYERALQRIDELNAIADKSIGMDELVASANSYTGLLKNRTDHKRLLWLRDWVSQDWWQYVEWNETKQCLSYKPGYSINERLNKKYNLKIKRYGRNGSNPAGAGTGAAGPHRREERALHGAHESGGTAAVNRLQGHQVHGGAGRRHGHALRHRDVA